jgi:hypothetical protein
MSSYAMLTLASMVLRLWFVDISFLEAPSIGE